MGVLFFLMPLEEKSLVERIARASQSAQPALRRTAPARVARSIGDDCAVLEAQNGQQILVTTDFSLEGVHFRREWHPADSIGHRTLIRGLSDIAAMGGVPFAAFLSLALPANVSQRWTDQFFDGLLNSARAQKQRTLEKPVAQAVENASSHAETGT